MMDAAASCAVPGIAVDMPRRHVVLGIDRLGQAGISVHGTLGRETQVFRSRRFGGPTVLGLAPLRLETLRHYLSTALPLSSRWALSRRAEASSAWDWKSKIRSVSRNSETAIFQEAVISERVNVSDTGDA
jgi:hypothetical protein